MTEEQRQEVCARTRQVGLASRTRDRREMVRLADAGWSGPCIARHRGQHDQTGRAWIKAFLAGGFDALPNTPRGGKQSALTTPLRERVRAAVAPGARTWTAAQLADGIAVRHGVRLSADRVRIHRRRAGVPGQRTRRTPRHTQDPDEGADRTARPCSRTAQKRGCRCERPVPAG